MDKSKKIGRLLLRFVDVGIGAIFIYAGVVKALDPGKFVSDIEKYKMVPWTVGALMALYLPWLEILCGAGLVFRRLYRGALWIVLTLTLFFLAALVSAKVRGLNIGCACFGGESHGEVIDHAIVRDVGIMIGLGILIAAAVVQRRRILAYNISADSPR